MHLQAGKCRRWSPELMYMMAMLMLIVAWSAGPDAPPPAAAEAAATVRRCLACICPAAQSISSSIAGDWGRLPEGEPVEGDFPPLAPLPPLPEVPLEPLEAKKPERMLAAAALVPAAASDGDDTDAPVDMAGGVLVDTGGGLAAACLVPGEEGEGGSAPWPAAEGIPVPVLPWPLAAAPPGCCDPSESGRELAAGSAAAGLPAKIGRIKPKLETISASCVQRTLQ